MCSDALIICVDPDKVNHGQAYHIISVTMDVGDIWNQSTQLKVQQTRERPQEHDNPRTGH